MNRNFENQTARLQRNLSLKNTTDATCGSIKELDSLKKSQRAWMRMAFVEWTFFTRMDVFMNAAKSPAIYSFILRATIARVIKEPNVVEESVGLSRRRQSPWHGNWEGGRGASKLTWGKGGPQKPRPSANGEAGAARPANTRRRHHRTATLRPVLWIQVP